MISDAELRSALLDAALLDTPDSDSAPMSRRQEKRIQSMLADPFGYARRMRRPWWKQTLQTAAMVAVTIGLSISLLAAVSPTVRATLERWYMEIRHSDLVYSFTGDTQEEILPEYTITALPEGYVETNCVDGLFSRHITYENPDGQLLRFSYVQMAQGGVHNIKTDGMELIDVTVNGHQGTFFRSVDPAYSNGIVWISEEDELQFTINGFENQLELLHIAESVSLVKTTK